MMRWLSWAIALILLSSQVLAEEPNEREVIRVTAGEQLDFKAPVEVQRVAVGDTAIADVSILGRREILILAKQPGETSLLLWEKKTEPARRYRIQVNPPLTSQMPLSGQVMVDVKFVELSKKVLKETGINLITQNNITFGLFSPSSLTKVTHVPYTSTTTDASVPFLNAFHLVLGSTNGSALGLLALLEENSLARTLAQPSMTVVSGQTASFMAGGEFPIPIAQSLGQVTITYKPYGIRLAFTPTVFSKDRIAIKLAPEVSELDFTNAVTSSGVSVPAILTRRAETTIELGDGESFVIAGLVSRSFADSVDKVPGLGDIPVLGAFFKSTRFSREDKELVIIVTPTLVRPLAVKAELPQLPGAEYDQYNPSMMKRLFYGGFATDNESVGLSR
ncbi:MAG TPA: pilus assembly protein N-terminal domain-containing protein [Sideroxyarcus sp.]|nr:pilus assembly protein N-terminal domain-containing protein [Sideroxyarcus sp.]